MIILQLLLTIDVEQTLFYLIGFLKLNLIYSILVPS